MVDRNRLASRRLRDDQRVDQPVTGQVSPAIRVARLYRRVSGAVRAGHLFPPVRQRPEFSHDGSRRPRNGRRRTQLAGDLLSNPGLACQTSS
ncbi:hypothetical protein D3C71_1478730 [compost metagenome]